MTVRTRIAPSPTGDPHVGTAYIALFNYCFAKSHGGEFLLRIEDTDQQRSTSASEQAIFDSLRWLGLDWDEGPDVGGAKGPYRQSERSAIYREHCDQLLANGHAFRCYRTADELNTMREARREAGLHAALKPSDLQLSADEQARREAAGEPCVIRMVVPEEEGTCEVDDMLRGRIEIDWAQVDAQILLKSDGMPTYHLANVVDDHLMEITHVLRGEEWINSAPKHKLLYQYFGWDMPVLCHLPLLRNPDKSKLSKRKNPTSIRYYQRMGFLPEAVLNYLGRMGWSMPDESEKFSLATMIEHFDITRVSLGGPIFDVEKLRWLNGMWLREDFSLDQVADRLQEWALNRDTLMKILPQLQSRVEVFSDIAPLASFFLAGMLPLQAEQFAELALAEEDLLTALQCCVWRLEEHADWQRDSLFTAIKELAEGLDIKLKDMMPPLFLAIAGTTSSVSVVDSMEILGPDMSRARLRHAIEVLGGVGKKRLKKMEKRYQSLPSQK